MRLDRVPSQSSLLTLDDIVRMSLAMALGGATLGQTLLGGSTAGFVGAGAAFVFGLYTGYRRVRSRRDA